MAQLFDRYVYVTDEASTDTDGVMIEPDQWINSVYQGSFSYEELDSLKMFCDDDSPERKEFHRLAVLLRMETAQPLAKKNDVSRAIPHSD